MCSASDHQGSNFESCVWRAALSHLSHHPHRSPDPVQPICAQRWPIHFIYQTHGSSMYLINMYYRGNLSSPDQWIRRVGSSSNRMGSLFVFSKSRYTGTMLIQYWTIVCDVGPTLTQHWVRVSYWLSCGFGIF